VQAELGKYDFLLIDGICLRDTMAQCGLRVGVFVYCRRITRAGLRADDPQNSARQGRPSRDDPSRVDWQSLTITCASIRSNGLISSTTGTKTMQT